jgi:hypothetical protein
LWRQHEITCRHPETNHSYLAPHEILGRGMDVDSLCLLSQADARALSELSALRSREMSLDCNTDRGRLYIARQHEIAARCGAMWESIPVATPDTKSSAVDAMFMRGQQLHAVAEIKARNLTLDQLRGFGSYLVTFEKLEKGRRLAASLTVPYLLIVGLWPEREIVWWKIADGAGEFQLTIRREHTPTQATCNGGKARRENAYLPLDLMRFLDHAEAPTATRDPATNVCTGRPLTADDIRW